MVLLVGWQLTDSCRNVEGKQGNKIGLRLQDHTSLISETSELQLAEHEENNVHVSPYPDF